MNLKDALNWERIDLIMLCSTAPVAVHVCGTLIVLGCADRLALRVVCAERELGFSMLSLQATDRSAILSREQFLRIWRSEVGFDVQMTVLRDIYL